MAARAGEPVCRRQVALAGPGNRAVQRALGGGHGRSAAVLGLLGLVGNAAARRVVSVQRQEHPPAAGGFQLRLPEVGESAGWRPPPSDEYRLRLDPWIEAYVQAMQALRAEVAPEAVSAAFAQLRLPVLQPALVPPSPPGGPAPPAAPVPAPAPTPGSGPGPGVQPEAGPGTRAGATGDIWRAVRAEPSIGPLLQRLQDEALARAHRDWVSLSTGEKVVVVTAGIALTGTALAGVLSSPEARNWAMSQFNGQMFPVPGVPSLRLEMNFSESNMLFGLHFDLGRFLPGFRPSDPRSLGQPPSGPPAQRMVDGSAPDDDPSGLSAALASTATGGTGLAPQVRAPLEGKLGVDLAPVRVHTGTQADRMARSVQAAAFTSGQHIYFAAGRYQPGSAAGDELLAHEVVHTIQQAAGPVSGSGWPVSVSDPTDRFEREASAVAAALSAGAPSARVASAGAGIARVQRQPVEVDIEPVTPAESERLRQQGITLPSVSSATGAALGAAPYSTVLPGYSQQGDTCGAASLVTALLIWDRDNWDQARPNNHAVNACNLILIAFARHGAAAITAWTQHPAPEVVRSAGSDRTVIQQAYTIVSQRLSQDVTRVRQSAATPGTPVTQNDYNTLGQALYFLWHQGSGPGLSAGEIQNMQAALGLHVDRPAGTGDIREFAAIFSHPALTGLAPGQIGQVSWFINRGAQHAFLIGRLRSGEFFLSDQGTSPATEFRAPSFADLASTVRTAVTIGTYWLFPGSSQEFATRFGTIPGWTGVTLLAPHTAVEEKARNIVPAGAFLAEIDAGPLTIGDRPTRGDFIAQTSSLADAQAQCDSHRGGSLIVEMPDGVFTAYTTTTVSDANLTQTTLDATDSSGGVLATRTYRHAWLRLSTSSGRHGSWFSVY